MSKQIKNVLFLMIFSLMFASCGGAADTLSRASTLQEVEEESQGLSESLAGLGRSRSMSSQASEPASDERMMAYSASLELSVKDNEETRKLLIELMRSSGGFIVNETESSIRTRIPSQNMDIFLAEARTFGNVENESKSGADITDQYRDNVARLNGLKNVRDRYLALLEQANTVSDILSIERELERVNTNIDILEGRIRHAESSVAYSIVTVKFREKTKLGPVGWIFYGLYRGVKWLFVWS